MNAPMNAPKKHNGTEMPNQRANRASIVVNGTAAELPTPQTNRLIMKNMENTKPGNPNAVSSVVRW